MFETLVFLAVISSVTVIIYILVKMYLEESKPMPHEKK